MSAGQYDKALVTYQSLLAKVSEPKQQSGVWTLLGETYLRKGDVQQAINSLEKAHQQAPESASLTTNLGLLYEMQNKMDIARKYYESSIKLDPNNALALNNLAYLMSQSNGDLDLALTYATKAKQRLPEHAEINDTLGWIYLKKSLTDQALDTFKNLVVKAPTNPTFHYHYAMALNQKGDRENAKKECQIALADKPNKQLDAEIRQLMAKVS